MAATVKYTGEASTHSNPHRARPCERGKPFPCSCPKALAYYRASPQYTVVEAPKAKALKTSEPAPQESQPAATEATPAAEVETEAAETAGRRLPLPRKKKAKHGSS